MKKTRLLFFDPFNKQYNFYSYIKEYIFKSAYILCILSLFSLSCSKDSGGNTGSISDDAASLMDTSIQAYARTPEIEEDLTRTYEGQPVESFDTMVDVGINMEKAQNSYADPINAVPELNVIANEIDAYADSDAGRMTRYFQEEGDFLLNRDYAHMTCDDLERTATAATSSLQNLSEAVPTEDIQKLPNYYYQTYTDSIALKDTLIEGALECKSSVSPMALHTGYVAELAPFSAMLDQIGFGHVYPMVISSIIAGAVTSLIGSGFSALKTALFPSNQLVDIVSNVLGSFFNGGNAMEENDTTLPNALGTILASLVGQPSDYAPAEQTTDYAKNIVVIPVNRGSDPYRAGLYDPSYYGSYTQDQTVPAPYDPYYGYYKDYTYAR